jgi:hypothetical protein
MSGFVRFIPIPDISDRTGHPPYRDVRLVRMSDGTGTLAFPGPESG